MPTRGLIAAAALAFTVASLHGARAAQAQNSVAPAAHWGMLTYPEAGQVQQIGFQHFLFTEFGKPGDGRYGDYGDMPTMGLSFLTLSNTRIMKRDGDLASNVLFASTLQVGWAGRQPGAFLQNQVQHNWDELAYVPRGREREAFDVGYNGEVAYWFLRSAVNRQGERVAVRTPLFVAAGFGVGTLMIDGYMALGVRHLVGPAVLWDWSRDIFFLSLSAISRLGLPLSTCQFDFLKGVCGFDPVAPYYVASQISLTAHLAQAYFPVQVELGYTGDSGLFVDKMRNPMPERFWTLRLVMSSFVFEIANDAQGDKDIGPTVATRFFINFAPGTPFVGKLLNVL